MLPVVTTTFSIQRATNIDGDSQDPLEWETVHAAIPGVPSYLSGGEAVAKGSRERVDARVFLDTDVEISHTDRLVDDGTGDTWKIAYVRRRTGLGLDHMVVGVYEVTGVAQGTRDL